MDLYNNFNHVPLLVNIQVKEKVMSNDKRMGLDALKDKTQKGMTDVMLSSFEYMLASICKEYCKATNIASVDEFNYKNKLNYFKALVFPFFVATSNGNSKSLYSLFGDFYTLSFGPTSMSIHQALESTEKLEYFKPYSSVNPFGIEVIDTRKSFDETIKEILETTIDLKDQSIKLNEIVIVNDNDEDSLLYKAIDKGIEIIVTQSNHTFFLADEQRIRSQAYQFDAFKKAYESNKIEVLNYNDITKNKSSRYREERSLAFG